MIREIEKAKKFLKSKFGSLENVLSGVYAVPITTSKGKAFMKVVVTFDKYLNDFSLYKDKKLKENW